jgi:phage protein D
VIKVGGEDVLRDLYLAVSTLTVDLKEKTAAHFSFTVVGAFDWEAGEFLATRRAVRVDLLELFAFGTTTEIWLGYGDVPKGRPLLTGLITEITTDFTAGSTPELSISGYDKLYPLTVGQETRHWENKPDSAAVTDVVSAVGVDTDVPGTSPSKLRIDRNNETAMVFIDKLAKRNGATFYHRDDAFYFGPRRNKAAETVELMWGQGLLSFSPQVNLARQVTEVRVHGRSAATGEAIVGTARRGDESDRDPGADSGGDWVATAVSKAPVLNLRAAISTQAEADARARAVLEERAEQFVTGNGESTGLPELVPDTNVLLRGLGRGFSKTYYVSEATHRIDSRGYRTSFKVQETTIR